MALQGQTEPGSPETGVSADTNLGAVRSRSLIRRVLRDILISPPFRSSKQCQELLRYVVEHSLTGDESLLRERVIGSEVFGRAPDYDTANDPIVRARIAEVRKRLAQYYLNQGRTASTRIEIPSGSYRARFEFLATDAPAEEHTPVSFPEPVPLTTVSPAPPQAEHQASTRWSRPYLWWILAAIIFIAAGGLLWFSMPSPQERIFNRFWDAALHSPVPVLVYTGTNVVYRFSPEFLERYRRDHDLEDVGPEFAVQLSSLKSIDPKDLSPSSNTYVSTGDVFACSAITSMLAQHNKAYQLRFAGDISAGDVRTSPTVLIGAFNNGWTLDVTRSTPFTFLHGDTIEDRQDKTRFWKVRTGPNGSTLDDYAVISRLILPQTKNIMLTAAGIGHYGTQAASDMLVDPQKIATVIQKAPLDWERKNLQVVIHVKVVDDSPGPVEIVATHFW